MLPKHLTRVRIPVSESFFFNTTLLLNLIVSLFSLLHYWRTLLYCNCWLFLRCLNHTFFWLRRIWNCFFRHTWIYLDCLLKNRGLCWSLVSDVSNSLRFSRSSSGILGLLFYNLSSDSRFLHIHCCFLFYGNFTLRYRFQILILSLCLLFSLFALFLDNFNLTLHNFFCLCTLKERVILKVSLCFNRIYRERCCLVAS